MTKEDALNLLIKDSDTNKISDGYHSFGELYEHRITLFITLCRFISSDEFYVAKDKNEKFYVWKSQVTSGWFILGIGTAHGKQISYHLPASKWDECNFANEGQPLFDGHISKDVLLRLKNL